MRPHIGPRYSREVVAQRGDEIYDRDVLPRLEPGDQGKFVAIDIETGAFEVDKGELAAIHRLLDRYADAQIWLKRVGSRYVRRL